MKPWRLTRRAERSLADIFTWTIEHFGERQAIAYRDDLIARIDAIASGEPPHPRPCSLLMQGHPGAEGLVYSREGGHYLIMRDSDDTLEVLEFFHQSANLPFHLDTLG